MIRQKTIKGTRNKHFVRNVMLSAGLSAGALLPMSDALAQSETDSENSSTQLETVTVTAERREQDIKDVPVSVSTLRGERLDAIGTSGQDVRVLAAKTPSLNIESSNGRAFPRFYIRGYGNTDFNLFASQPVSLVYDDIVQESPILKGFPMFDLAGVEVLRGPQGSLFGRNTPAGVVKFNSARPSVDGEEGYFSLSTGTYDTTNVEGAVNLPMGPNWAMRASILSQHRDDWVDNTFTGKNDDLEGYDDRAARLQLLYKGDNGFEALFNVHGRDLDGSARLFRANAIRPGSNSLISGFDVDEIGTDGENKQELRTAGANARLSWDLGDYKAYSITGYETVSKYFSRGDIDGGNPTDTPFSVETSGEINDHEQLSQEFRIESQYAGPLNWQAGTFLFHEDVTGTNNNYAASTGDTIADYVESRQKNDAYAVFGALNYAATERLTLTGGLRYTLDKKEFGVEKLFNTTVTGPLSDDNTYNKLNWDASAIYALTPELNLYARVATGFRAPSYAAPSATVPLTVADAETTISYEVGMKADLFDRRARLNFDVYRYDVKDQQLTAVGGASNDTMLINADKTLGYGAEMDLEAYLTERLLVTLGGSYNYTELKDKELTVAGCGAGCTMKDPLAANGNYSIDGNSLPQAPEAIANLTVRYGIPMGARQELYFYSDVAYRSKINFFLYDSTEFTGDPLLEIGARIGYIWEDGKYEVAGFCRNCANQIRTVGAIDFNNLTAFTNDPRIVGTQFKMMF